MITNTSKSRSNAGGLLTAIALLVPTLMVTGCSSGAAKSGQPEGPPALPVKIEVAREVPIRDTTDYVATLKSRDSAVINPQVEGYITKIFVHSGDHVSPGAPIMQIDPTKQEATVRSQENSHAAQQANLKYAQEQYDRVSQLYAAGVDSKQDYDQAKSALDSAKAQLASLDAQVNEQRVELHYYRVVSPSNGIVGDIPVRVGDRVTTTTLLTTVDQPGSLEVYVYVPIERASGLKMNLPVQLIDGAGNVIADSRVSFISPEVDNSTQTILVKARVANNQDKLRHAQFVRARVIWGTRNSSVVPILAVSRIGGQYFAFVAEEQNGKMVARQKPLKVGDTVGNNYVVLDGIKPGDRVIVSGTQVLIDGATVEAQNPGSGL
jgi:RND family efflux transporter MFP subunit